jgi:hypothetical protein
LFKHVLHFIVFIAISSLLSIVVDCSLENVLEKFSTEKLQY